MIGLTSVTIAYAIASFATRKAILRGEEFYHLLIDLEKRALDDYDYDLKVQNLHTVNNPSIHLTIQRKNFRKPLKTILNASSNDDAKGGDGDVIEKGKEEKNMQANKNMSVEKGEENKNIQSNNNMSVKKGEGDKDTQKNKNNMRNFYDGLSAPLHIYIFLSMVSMIPYVRNAIQSFSDGQIIKFLLETLVVISLFLFTLGEAFYAITLILRWTGLTQHCARSWGYELSDIILRYGEKATSDTNMKIGTSEHKNFLKEFEEKLDVLHDIFAVPLTVLNQKISSVMSNGLVSFVFVMIAHAAFAFVSTNRTPQVNGVVSVCCIIIIGVALYYAGNISQTFVLQKHSLRRPSIIASLSKIYGSYEAVQMFMTEYIMYDGFGFSFLSVIFTHQAAMGVMITFFLGLGFLFGPLLAKKLMGVENEEGT